MDLIIYGNLCFFKVFRIDFFIFSLISETIMKFRFNITLHLVWICLLAIVTNACHNYDMQQDKFPKLKRGKLNLSNSHLTEIPDYVWKLTDLRVLNLHNNKITKIPAEIKQLVNLEKLIISRNDLVELPEEIGELKNLEILSVKANKLESIPSSIGQLKNLEVLRLSFNKLTFLPSSIGELDSLSHFYIDYNEIEFLPNEIGQLKNLAEFIIGRNRLVTLPPEFYSLYHLNTLDLSYAGPTLVLPYEICLMRNIETLYIDRATLDFSPRCLTVRANGVRFNLILK